MCAYVFIIAALHVKPIFYVFYHIIMTISNGAFIDAT